MIKVLYQREYLAEDRNTLVRHTERFAGGSQWRTGNVTGSTGAEPEEYD